MPNKWQYMFETDTSTVQKKLGNIGYMVVQMLWVLNCANLNGAPGIHFCPMLQLASL